MQIPRPVHQFRLWSARWLRPSFVWPEAGHERVTALPADVGGGIVSVDVSRSWGSGDPETLIPVRPPVPPGMVEIVDVGEWPPRYVAGSGELDDLEVLRFVGEGAGSIEDAR